MPSTSSKKKSSRKQSKKRHRKHKKSSPTNIPSSRQPPNTNGHHHRYNGHNTNGQLPSSTTPSDPIPPSPTKLTSDENFLGHRSPFYECLSRHCVMPICQKQLINFQFNLPPHYVSDIQKHRKSKKHHTKHVNHDATSHQRLLHIRLFDLTHRKHIEFDESFLIKINGAEIKIDTTKNKKKKKPTKKKSKVFKYVQPLDISKHASATMSFEIACHKAVFYGAASIEIVNLLTVDALAARVIRRSELATALHTLCDSKESVSQTCKICGSLENLSRCSRCKATWYCSREHQQQDWNAHNLGCKPYVELNRLRLKNKNPAHKESDEDIICNEIKVNIRDPLSLCRISVPVRGIHCYHPQCVDLTTYLSYSHHTKTWQCPICVEKLVYTDLVVDESMKKIINEVGNDIDVVRLNPDDYSYKVITLKEQQQSDGFDDKDASCSSLQPDKKRKINELSDDEDAGPQKKKRKKDHHNGNGTVSTKKNIDIIVLD
eukprot:317807_1